MISRWRGTALCLLLLLIATGSGATEPVGFVAAVQGLGEVRTRGGSFALATLDRNVAVGDVVRTRPEGWLKVLLADDTTVALDAISELRIDRFAGRAEAEVSRLTLVSGHARIKLVDDFGRRIPLELVTPHARIEARGTEWLTWVASDVTWVCAVSGSVAVRTDGEPLAVAAGNCARASAHVESASRPKELRAVAMRPGGVKRRAPFPANLPEPSLTEGDRVVIDPNDLLRPRLPEEIRDGRPPASSAVP